MWRNIWGAATWLIPGADFYAVLEACRNFEEYELLRLERELDIFPRTYHTPQGQELSHPKIAQLKDARQALNIALSDIGFSPRGRAQLEMSSATDGDPIDVLKQKTEESRAANIKYFAEIMEAHNGKI
jgi:P27 family predicted phage terminase small subunit